MEFERGHDRENVSVLYLMQNCKILYCSLYLECWRIVMYRTSANSSWNIKCQHWRLYHLPILNSIYRSLKFASPIPGGVGCPLLQTTTSWSSLCGRIWSESWAGVLPTLPAQPAPACAALPCRATSAVSPADCLWDAEVCHKWNPHICTAVQGLSSLHNRNPYLMLWVTQYTFFL